MQPFTAFSAAEQVAEHLRAELLRGSFSGTMPGVNPLVAELGVNHKTVKAALRILEYEGLLVNQGRGVQRRIALPEDHAPPALRVGVLAFDLAARSERFMVELCHLLEESGHTPFFPDKTLEDLGRNVNRVARYVKKTEADAWVVCAGSHEVLEWFVRQETPAFALFGVRAGLPIAGTAPDKVQPFAEFTRRLIKLGHRRISFLSRREIRLPKPALSISAFLDELETAGVVTGEFNLPDWEENPEGFKRCLDSLFEHTPPTALILDEPFLFNAGFHYLAQCGLRVPQDVSLICTDGSPEFSWCQPSVAHIRWDYRPVVRRIQRWANNVARGKDDRRQSFTKAKFVEGGTIGPVRGD
jgi:DNA-binding LacI/PurR family transcriptional regulator